MPAVVFFKNFGEKAVFMIIMAAILITSISMTPSPDLPTAGEEAVVYTGDLKKEESILEWLMVQKDPSNDAIEEMEGDNLRKIVESSDAVAVFVCKYQRRLLPAVQRTKMNQRLAPSTKSEY